MPDRRGRVFQAMCLGILDVMEKISIQHKGKICVSINGINYQKKITQLPITGII